jgi:hypothetical protein
MMRVRVCHVLGLGCDGRGKGEMMLYTFLMLQDGVQYWE